MSLSFFLGAWPVGVVAGRGLAPPLRNGTRGLLARVAGPHGDAVAAGRTGTRRSEQHLLMAVCQAKGRVRTWPKTGGPRPHTFSTLHFIYCVNIINISSSVDHTNGYPRRKPPTTPLNCSGVTTST
jgi:hypothetical protein